jgi:hypothetical protein
VVADVTLNLIIQTSPSDASKLVAICNFLQDLVSSKSIKLSEVSVLAIELFNNAAGMCVPLVQGKD